MQLLDVLTPNLNLVYVLACRCQVIGELHSQPRFRGAAESFGQPYSHLRANARLAVHDVIESLARNTKHLRARRHRKSQRLKAIMADDAPRMSRVFHRHKIFFLSNGSRSIQRQRHPPLQTGKRCASWPARSRTRIPSSRLSTGAGGSGADRELVELSPNPEP